MIVYPMSKREQFWRLVLSGVVLTFCVWIIFQLVRLDPVY